MKQRDSNLELLRIFSMILIVYHHACSLLWFPIDASVTSSYVFKELSYGFIGSVGNWLFILVSGFYITSNSFSWKKEIKLWFQIFSTSAIIGVIVWISKTNIINFDTESTNVYLQNGFDNAANPINLKSLIASFMPNYFGIKTYWFASAYLVFFVISPYLIKFIEGLTKNEFLHINIILVILGTIIPMFPMESFFMPSTLLQFIIGLFLSKYIRIYGISFLNSKAKNTIIAAEVFVLVSLYKTTILVTPPIYTNIMV